jgi:hypothetical protein
MTHPVTKLVNASYMSVATMSSNALHELLASAEVQHGTNYLTRCVLLMELLYRITGPHPEVPALVWTLVFSDIANPPEGLMSPSEAHPHLRGPAQH